MSNISYCRFENTARDLADCVNALNNGHTEYLSSYERRGLSDLLYYAQRIIDLEDDIIKIIESE